MNVFQGRSQLVDPGAAVAEATAGVPSGTSPNLVIAFASRTQELAAVAASLEARYPSALVIGCSSAGEILDGMRGTGSLVVSVLCTPEIRWAATLMDGVRAGLDIEGGVARVCAALGCDRDGYVPGTYFAMLLIDGLTGKEELVSAALAEALCGIPLVGGSASDALTFQHTEVFLGRELRSDAAVVILAHAPHGYELFKHQHYLASPRPLAVTSAVPSERRVNEFDGRPAAAAYAAAVGVTMAEIVGDVNQVTFMNPVIFSCGGDIYVRSVRKIDPDGVMHFHSTIEEGMVMDIAGRADMVEELGRTITTHLAAHAKADLFIGFNCILRALEGEQLGVNLQLAAEWRRLASQSVGFDTYGEIWNGLHINQTLVGVALRAAPSTTR
jgi:hypothetical protein